MQADVICGTVEASCRCVLSAPGSSEDWDGPRPDDYMPIVISRLFGGLL